MKIRPLFIGLMHYPTAAELAELNAGDRDMRHPDDRTPDLSKPVVQPGFKKKAIQLAKTIWDAGKKHDK